MISLVGAYGRSEYLHGIIKELGVSYNNLIKYGEDVPLLWVPGSIDLDEGIIDFKGSQHLFAFNNSGCVMNPRIRGRVINQLIMLRDSVVLDALRYPSPHDGDAFLSCFCRYCVSREPELVGVRELIIESLSAKSTESFINALGELSRARCDLICGLVRELRSFNSTVKLIGVLFPPSLSALVGQDYRCLANHLDEVHVMLYHRCGGPACLNHELASLIKLASKYGLNPSKVLEGLGIPIKYSDMNPAILESRGVSPDIIINEALRARELLGDSFKPILWFDSNVKEIINGLSREGLNEFLLFIP